MTAKATEAEMRQEILRALGVIPRRGPQMEPSGTSEEPTICSLGIPHAAITYEIRTSDFSATFDAIDVSRKETSRS